MVVPTDCADRARYCNKRSRSRAEIRVCFLLLKTVRPATIARAPVGARKDPIRLRKFDPVRHVSVGEVSGPIRWQPPVSNQEPNEMAGIPRTKPSIASTISLRFAMERVRSLDFSTQLTNRLSSTGSQGHISRYLDVERSASQSMTECFYAACAVPIGRPQPPQAS